MSRDLGTIDRINLTRYCGSNHKLNIQLTVTSVLDTFTTLTTLTPTQCRKLAIRLLQAADLCEKED